mgnify:CR=1 FL=1
MLKSITGRPLWVNVLVGIVLAIGLFALFLLSLNWLTGHGKSSSVPSVTGKSYEEARSILKKAGFDVEIQDSVYVDTVPALHVIKQIPEADEVVKSNRTVFLVIRRAVPPEVEMPNLSGYSFRNAEMVSLAIIFCPLCLSWNQSPRKCPRLSLSTYTVLPLVFLPQVPMPYGSMRERLGWRA